MGNIPWSLIRRAQTQGAKFPDPMLISNQEVDKLHAEITKQCKQLSDVLAHRVRAWLKTQTGKNCLLSSMLSNHLKA